MKHYYQKYFFLLGRDLKKNTPILLLFFIISSFFDLVGIGLVGLLLLLMSNFDLIESKYPAIFSLLISKLSQQTIIFSIAFLLILSFFLKAVWNIVSQKYIAFVVGKMSIQLKMRLVYLYQQADYFFHIQNNSTDLMNKIYSIDGFVNNVFLMSLGIIASLFSIISITLFLMLMHPLITLLLIVVVAIIFLSYQLFYKKKLIAVGQSLMVFNAKIGKSILATLSGLKEIRVFHAESFFSSEIESAATGYANAVASNSVMQIVPRSVIECVASVFLVLLMLIVFAMSTNPLDMIPILGVFAAACVKLLPLVSKLIVQVSQLHSANYVTNLLYNEIVLLEQAKNNMFFCQEKLPFSTFSLQNVTFRYPKAKKDVLINVNYTFLRGQSVGVMGKSGAGKSTLINIVLGLIRVHHGHFLVDGVPLKNFRPWLNNIAYIPQNIFILDDTLKNNIVFGIPESDIDEEKLYQAIAMAQLSDVVESLIDGVDTFIGENGVRLSGGQRQRVALARALYYEREIIVMDEATSALDGLTEFDVMNAIKKLRGIKTLIIIAHRLTTLAYCDTVVELEDGKIKNIAIASERV